MSSVNENTDANAIPILPHSNECLLKTLGHLTPLCRWNKKNLEELIKTGEKIKQSIKEAEAEEASLQDESILLAIEYHKVAEEIIQCEQRIKDNIAIANARVETEKSGPPTPTAKKVATPSNSQNALDLKQPNVGSGSVSSPKS